MPVSPSWKVMDNDTAEITFIGPDAISYVIAIDTTRDEADYVQSQPRAGIIALVEDIACAIGRILDKYPALALQYSLWFTKHYHDSLDKNYDSYVMMMACAGLIRCDYSIAKTYGAVPFAPAPSRGQR